MSPQQRLVRIRIWLSIFITGLVLSGITAFPLLAEVRLARRLPLPGFAEDWLARVQTVLESADPLMFYGTDWLAFAHFMIALAFIGPLRDPARNVWVVHWGMLCCIAIVPLALIGGPIRGIPFWWQLIDISFGVLGIIPLWIVNRHIKALPPS